jgi:zinc protease
MATVQLVLSGDYTPGSKINVQLSAIRYILGFRLIQRLREQEGGVYSPRISVSNSRSPRSRYAYFIQFNCAPANVEKLIAAAWDEIGKLKANGPSPDDLKKFVAEEKVSIKNAMETNGFWLTYLSNQYEEKDDPVKLLGYDERLEALTAAQLKNAFNIYLNEKNYIRVVLVPETSK